MRARQGEWTQEQRKKITEQLATMDHRVRPGSQKTYNYHVKTYEQLLQTWGFDPYDKVVGFEKLFEHFVRLRLYVAVRKEGSRGTEPEYYVSSTLHAAVGVVATAYRKRTGLPVSKEVQAALRRFVKTKRRLDPPTRQAAAVSQRHFAQGIERTDRSDLQQVQDMLLALIMTHGAMRSGDIRHANRDAVDKKKKTPLVVGDVNWESSTCEIVVQNHKNSATACTMLYAADDLYEEDSVSAVLNQYLRLVGYRQYTSIRCGRRHPQYNKILFMRIRFGKPTKTPMSRHNIEQALQRFYQRGGFPNAHRVKSHTPRRSGISAMQGPSSRFSKEDTQIVSRHRSARSAAHYYQFSGATPDIRYDLARRTARGTHQHRTNKAQPKQYGAHGRRRRR